MEDNIRLTVIGIQSNAEDNDPIELQTTGKWFNKNNKEHIIYTDHQLIDTQPTKTRVSIDGSNVSVIRSGGINTHLVFEQGVSHIIPYETSFGILEMVSYTKEISLTVTKTTIELKVIYNLEINHTDMGENIFHISATRLDD